MKLYCKLLITAFITLISTGCFTIIQELAPAEYDIESTEEHFKILYSSHDNQYLTQLRSEFELDKIVSESETELEKVLTITTWVNSLWDHHSSNQPKDNDPISILREVEQGKRFRCVEYAIVINGCLNSLGIRSRILWLRTADMQKRLFGAGHVVVEAYDQELKKWYMIDGQWGVIPTIDGVPASAYELREALARHDNALDILTSDSNPEKAGQFFHWIAMYLYHFVVRLDQRVPSQEPYSIMLLPIEAEHPTVFQRFFPLTDYFYTNSIASFYPVPHQ